MLLVLGQMGMKFFLFSNLAQQRWWEGVLRVLVT